MTYTKNVWQSGDTLTAVKMNNIETGLEAVAQELSNVTSGLSEEEVKALFKIFAINQEVLLFKADRWAALFDFFVTKEVDYTGSSFADGTDGFEQWFLAVQSFTVIGNKYGWNAENIVADESRGCDIPICITTGFKCSTKTTRREG